MSEIKKPRSKTNMLTQRELKQESKSWEAIQQSILIYLLTKQGYVVTIERPDKFAHLSKHFFVISTLRLGTQVINLSEKITSMCASSLKPNAKSCQQKQLKRHCDKSRCSLSVNLLIEIAQHCGFGFTTRGTRSSIYTIKMVKFSEITHNGSSMYKKDDIFEIGGKVNDILRGACIDAFGKHTVEISSEHFKEIDLGKGVSFVSKESPTINAMMSQKYITESRTSTGIANDCGNQGNDDDFNNNSVTTDDYVSRSTSRNEINERGNSPLCVFKKVSFGKYYFIIQN